jgi:hypothetical protein
MAGRPFPPRLARNLAQSADPAKVGKPTEARYRVTYNDIDEQPRTSPETPTPGRVVGRSRGKGGHIMVQLGGRFAMVPTGSGRSRLGTFRAILRQLGLRPEDLR